MLLQLFYEEHKSIAPHIDNFWVDFTIISIEPSTTISNWLKGPPSRGKF